MKIDATLIGAGCLINYENGFFTNDNDVVIGKIKNPMYELFVFEGLNQINKIHEQNRPVKDDSLEISFKIIELLNSLIVWI